MPRAPPRTATWAGPLASRFACSPRPHRACECAR
jgi:hypothetical protein